MTLIFIALILFALVLIICLTIIEDKRRTHEKNKLNKNLKDYENANRL